VLERPLSGGCGCDEIWVDCYKLNNNGEELDRPNWGREADNRRETGPGISGIFKSGEMLEVVVTPEQLRGFHNDPEMKQSCIMAAVGREAADFDMSHEDAKQLCRSMIENLFGGTIQTLSHLEGASFHGYKKHFGL
jgi:hypothetical protein